MVPKEKCLAGSVVQIVKVCGASVEQYGAYPSGGHNGKELRPRKDVVTGQRCGLARATDEEPLIASLLLVAMPGAPNSVLPCVRVRPMRITVITSASSGRFVSLRSLEPPFSESPAHAVESKLGDISLRQIRLHVRMQNGSN